MNELTKVGTTTEFSDVQAMILKRLPEHLREAQIERWKAGEKFVAPPTQAERLAPYRDRARRLCGLSGKQWDNTLDSYELIGSQEQIASQRAVIDAARGFVSKWPNVERGLMLWGDAGRGKDGILQAITHAVIDLPRVYDVFYAYALDIQADMLADWKRYDDPETSIEDRCRGVRLLLIGDLGTLFALDGHGVTNDQLTRAAMRIVNQAASTGRPVLCATTNSSPEQWEEHLPDNVCSRLHETCDWLELKGPDRRRLRGPDHRREERTRQ